jgi:hypothetical protein
MESKEHRRKSKRYPVRWKAAVVFEKSAGKPVLHTQTHDLSAGGAAIVSEYGDIAGTVVTLLLAQPPNGGGEPPKMLKVRAKVVSGVETRNKPPGYRYGLSFFRAPDDGLDMLEQLLTAALSAAQAEPPQEAAPAPGGRLAKLKELAQAKLSEAPKLDPQVAINERVSGSLQRALDYLKELAEQLNVVKPAYPRGYTIVGVPEFSGLAWENGRADFRAREVSKSEKLMEQVTLNYRITADRKLRVARESPASERLRQLLTDNRIEFTERSEGSRGTLFMFPCEVKAYVLFEGNFETGTILLRTRNVERFGNVEHKLVPEAITEASMEEFAGFILAENPRVGPLLLKGA